MGSVAKVGFPFNARKEQTSADRAEAVDLDREGLIPLEPDAHPVVSLREAVLVLDAKTEVEHEIVVHSPVVLDEAAVVVDELVRRIAHLGAAAAGQPQQHIGEVVTGPSLVEGEVHRRGAVELHALLLPLESELERVGAHGTSSKRRWLRRTSRRDRRSTSFPWVCVAP